MCGGKAAYRPSGYAKPMGTKELYAYAKVLWEKKYGKKWCEEKALEAHNKEREALTKYNGNDKYSTAWDVLVLNYRGRKEAFKEVLEKIRSNRVK